MIQDDRHIIDPPEAAIHASNGGLPRPSGASDCNNGEMPGSAEAKTGILVVDDDHMVRLLFHSALSESASSFRRAADGREAIELYCSHRKEIDAVVLDVRMPGMDGPETLDALHN